MNELKFINATASAYGVSIIVSSCRKREINAFGVREVTLLVCCNKQKLNERMTYILVKTFIMSLRIIDQMIKFVQIRLEVDEEDIIIKTIEINEHLYLIEMNINGNLCYIKHFEPTHPVQGVNYDMGPNYDLFVFKVDTNRYERVSNKSCY